MSKKEDFKQKSQFLNIIPGLLLCFAIVILGILLSNLIGNLLVQFNILPEGSASPISAIFTSILIGLLISNFLGVHSIFQKGIVFSSKYVLRIGIVLLGLRLSLSEVLKLGAWVLPLIIVCITCGLAVTLYFTKKMKQSYRLGALIACGTGICGVTAIMATAPVIKAKDNEISYAVANITIFGLIGMLLYPYLANILFQGDPIKIGLFLGTAIHDTAQVTGAALIYSEMYNLNEVLDIATVTKLTRNLFIIAVIPFVSYLYFKANTVTDSEQQKEGIPKWYKFIPFFIIVFILFVIVRTIGDFTLFKSGSAFWILGEENWEMLYNSLSSLGSTYMLGIAMAAIGLGINFKSFKGMGLKPFYIGFIAAVSVGIVSFTLVSLFGHLIVI